MLTISNADAVKAKISKAQTQLTTQLAALQTSEDWRNTLERIAVLGPTSIARFSFRNLVLLLAQRPTIRHAATFNGWEKLGRNVKRGEKGLTVLRPRIVKDKARKESENEEKNESKRLAGFSYLTVFALEQTEGAALPEAVHAVPVDSAEGFTWTLGALQGLVVGIPGVAGISVRPRDASDHPAARGWFDVMTHQIVVISGETSSAQQAKTLFHEVAHAILHGDGAHHETATAEVEAESTAFVVAHAMGLDTASYSLPYVATWALEGNETDATRAVAKAGERIRKAAAVILGKLMPETGDEAQPPTSIDTDEIPEVEEDPGLKALVEAARPRVASGGISPAL